MTRSIKTLTDADGDKCSFTCYDQPHQHPDSGVYMEASAKGGVAVAAGPFTPEALRAALDAVTPAGSDTRTDEEDWKARAEKATAQLHYALDEQAKLIKERGAARVAARLARQQRDAEKERAEKAEQERDEARRERDSWRAQVPLAEWEKELIRAADQPRALTAREHLDAMRYRKDES